MLSKNLLGLSGLLAVGTASVTPLELRQNDVCLPGQGVTTVYVGSSVVAYPVVINQFFESNTVINIGNIDITINNAPTSLSTIFTATTTAATTVTATTTVQVTATATPFVLVTVPVGAAKKRQTGNSFVGNGGTTVDSCSSAAVFTIEFGQLKSGGNFLSTDMSLSEQVFTVSPTTGSISTTFSIDAEGFLAWSNGNFTGGFALYSQANGVNSISFDGSYPTGSTGLDLVYLPADECGNTSSTASSTTSSTASSTSLPTITTATPSATAFSLAVTGAGAKHKRQATTYVAAGGILTDDPAEAETFFLTSAKLFSGEGVISINSTSTISPFAGSLFAGDIATSFTNAGILVFSNSSFPSGSAGFCTQDDTLFIVLSGQPTGCLTVQLVPVAANPSFGSTSSSSMSSSSFSFFSNSTSIPTLAATSNAAAASSALAAASSDLAAATSELAAASTLF